MPRAGAAPRCQAAGGRRVSCFNPVGEGTLHSNIFPTEEPIQAKCDDPLRRITETMHDLAASLGSSVTGSPISGGGEAGGVGDCEPPLQRRSDTGNALNQDDSGSGRHPEPARCCKAEGFRPRCPLSRALWATSGAASPRRNRKGAVCPPLGLTAWSGPKLTLRAFGPDDAPLAPRPCDPHPRGYLKNEDEGNESPNLDLCSLNILGGFSRGWKTPLSGGCGGERRLGNAPVARFSRERRARGAAGPGPPLPPGLGRRHNRSPLTPSAANPPTPGGGRCGGLRRGPALGRLR